MRVIPPGTANVSLLIMSAFDESTIIKSMRVVSIDERARQLYNSGVKFTDPNLNIHPLFVQALTIDMKFEFASVIQASSIPKMMEGYDLIAQAQAGSGKTVAFVIGMLSKIDPNIHEPQAMCISPTRELVIQTAQIVGQLSQRLGLIRCICALSEKEADGAYCMNQPNIKRCTDHIICGSPGTVKQWIQRQVFDPRRIAVLVLDEADMFIADPNKKESKGLSVDTMFIKSKLHPENCQVLFFSATFSDTILSFAKRLMKAGTILIRPKTIEESLLDVVLQLKMDTTRHPQRKLGVLRDLYNHLMVTGQSIIFVETRDSADAIARLLVSEGLEISLLHGRLSTQERDRVMHAFKTGASKVLITTNVLARGVDVPAVGLVVNYDIPVTQVNRVECADVVTYLHRINRCGRFGREGTAITFLDSPMDCAVMQAIESHYRPAGAGEAAMALEWDCLDIDTGKLAEYIRHRGGPIVTLTEDNSDTNDNTNSQQPVIEAAFHDEAARQEEDALDKSVAPAPVVAVDSAAVAIAAATPGSSSENSVTDIIVSAESIEATTTATTTTTPQLEATTSSEITSSTGAPETSKPVRKSWADATDDDDN